MTTPQWQPGTLYNPGAIVRRVSAPPVVSAPPANPGFELGDSDWTKGTGWAIVNDGDAFSGVWSAEFTNGGGNTSDARIYNDVAVPVNPGMSITATCQVQQGASTATRAGAQVQLDWLDASSVLIRTDSGNLVDNGSGGAWAQSLVTGIAPPNAAYVRAAAKAFRIDSTHDLWIDNFSWNYAYQPPIDGLVFRAVQPDAGFSAATEPLWPDTLGEQVIDNEVIWEAINSSIVTWEANPILVSGAYEPSFPLFVGETVADNTIKWVAVSRRVEDEKCPNTKIVAIAASKIFCADEDIIAYSATVNPLDWTTTDDAGYLPFGLQTYGANPVLAMGLYRSNIVAFNSQAFQMWQVDQDPANMALLDAVPIACTQHKSVQPVQNDLVFLSAVGIRNIGIAGASTNLQAGTFGENIDPLVTAAVRANDYTPHGVYIPAYGQYWLFFGPQAFVLTITNTKSMSWSRYVFPTEVVHTTMLGDDLYLRTADDKVWRVDDLLAEDDVNCPEAEFDLPYLPDELGTGTLLVDANYFIDRRNLDEQGVELTGDSYGGSTATFADPVRALVMYYNLLEEGMATVEFEISGTYLGSPVSETITVEVGQTWPYTVGDQLFDTIETAEQINANNSDVFFSIGVQQYIVDLESDTLVVTMQGALAVSNNSSSTEMNGGSTSNTGLLASTEQAGGQYTLPADSYVIVRHNANTMSASRTFTVDSVDAIVLPAGNVGRTVVGAELTPQVTGIVRTGSGGSTPVVDFGIQFTVATECLGEEFEGVMEWPFLDFSTFGVSKQFIGVDMVTDAPEGLTVSILYDQRNRASATTPYEIDADTLPGQLIPIAVSAPSFAVRLVFAGAQIWEWQACNIYVNDMRRGS